MFYLCRLSFSHLNTIFSAADVSHSFPECYMVANPLLELPSQDSSFCVFSLLKERNKIKSNDFLSFPSCPPDRPFKCKVDQT